MAVGEAHRRYTNFINARSRWTGHLFQSRFASVAMDEGHLLAAVRNAACGLLISVNESLSESLHRRIAETAIEL